MAVRTGEGQEERVERVVAGARVGHSGGELVYRYGAASAYTGDHVSAGEVTGKK